MKSKSILKYSTYLLIAILIYLFFLSFYWDLGLGYANLKSVCIMLLMLATLLLNKYVFIPKFLVRKKPNKVKYILILVLSILTITTLDYFVDKWLFSAVVNQEFAIASLKKWMNEFELNPDSFYLLSNNYITIPLVILTILFSNTLHEFQAHNKKVELQKSQLSKQKVEAELNFLKTQINPHFLFNALGSLYSMSYMKMDGLTENIAKLSDMLRYLIYECNEKEVSLEKELLYLNSFIDFQLLKLEDSESVKFISDIENPSVLIEPMLLEPLLENAFKHSGIESKKDAYISITLTEKKKKLRFEIVNSVNNKGVKKDKFNGIGLQNIKNRLDLKYLNRYTFDQEITDQYYKICLQINLS